MHCTKNLASFPGLVKLSTLEKKSATSTLLYQQTSLLHCKSYSFILTVSLI